MKSLIPLVSLVSMAFIFPAKAAEQASMLPLSIYCPIYAEGLKTVFVKTGDDSYHGVALSKANVVISKDALVTDGKISLHGPSVGDQAYPVVTTADVSGIRQPLLLMVPAKDAGVMAYKSKIVEGELDQFPMGSFKLVNLSPNPVRITAGEDIFEIKAGADTLFKANVPAGGAMPVTIDQQIAGKWQLVSSSQWASRDDRRTLVCFLLDPVSKRMKIQSVPLRTAAK